MSKNEHNAPNGHGARLIIGYLAPAIHGGSVDQWRGVVDAVQKHDVNLICCPGSNPNFPSGFRAQANVLYDLVTPENVNGVVTWASSIGNYMTIEELQTFHERYRPLPMVAIGRTLEGIPSVLMDSYIGMREAIAHLIEVHGHRRLAFVRGPEGHSYAQERYRAYVETLKAYGIPFDSNLVTPPSVWGRVTGREEMRLLLDERKLRPQVDFTAVAAANDELILGALEALQAGEIQVPEEVAIAGFDDILSGRTSTPPLTSVAAPFYEAGYQAVEALLALIEGEQVPEEMTVPSKLVVRQSCGCLAPAVTRAATGLRSTAGLAQAGRKTLEDLLVTQRKDILVGMAEALGTLGEKLDAEWPEQLLDSFTAELIEGATGVFLATLEDTLRRVMEAAGYVTDGNVATMHDVVSTLRRNLLPHLDRETLSRAENLWQQARVMIGETAHRAQAYETLQVEWQAAILREMGQALLTTFDVRELMDVLAHGLPRLDIPSAYLSLYENPQPYVHPDPAPESSRLVLAYTEKGRTEIPSDGLRFPSRQLVPKGTLPRRQYSYVTIPLFFQEHQIGFALLEVGPREGAVYDVLRGGISSALQGALLLQARDQAEKALKRAYAEVELQVVERTAELQREIEERERAQEENFRLQQEIIESQKHALQELSTPVIPILEGIIVIPLIGSIDSLRARDITRRLLAGVREHRAKIVILDITGVPIVDSGVANHLNKTIQAARLKGARTIITGISEAIAETIVDLGIDWSGIETLQDLQTGLQAALNW